MLKQDQITDQRPRDVASEENLYLLIELVVLIHFIKYNTELLNARGADARPIIQRSTIFCHYFIFILKRRMVLSCFFWPTLSTLVVIIV